MCYVLYVYQIAYPATIDFSSLGFYTLIIMQLYPFPRFRR